MTNDGGKSLTEFAAKAADQFRSELGDIHAFRDNEFATEDGPSLVIVGKLAIDAAILAFLIPAEAAIRNRFRADELKRAEQGIALRDEKRLPENRDFDELFVRPKDFVHDGSSAF
jgi:hypothetical protein